MNEKGFVSEKRFVSKKNLSRAWRRLFGKVLNSKEEIEANTSENMIAGAEAVKEVYSSLTNVNVYVGDDEKLHFVDSAGADSVLPFSSESNYKINFSVTTMLNYSYPTISTGSITIQNGTASVSYGGGNTKAADDGHMGRTHAISVTSVEKI